MVKFRTLIVGLSLILLVAILMTPISDVNAQDGTPPVQTAEPTQVSVEVVNDYYSVVTATLADGTRLSAQWINGPSEPPDLAAWEASRVTALDRDATQLPFFPSYSWVYGCSAVSGAMIAAYYDNNGYTNMYSGPTNGGVMPQTDTYWDAWNDGHNNFPNNPLIASHNGIDGHAGDGSLNDYWVSLNSEGPEPWEDDGLQHAWGTAIGDYMKTSQWAYNNIDGETRFYNYWQGEVYSHERLTCSTLESEGYGPNDGTVGRKLFYEERGYTVTDCYSQYVDAVEAGGFSLADYQAEIDAGHPVMINLEGHTVVGFGYDGSTIYIRDTWDSDIASEPHYMTWGGSYQTMAMKSVSIVHLDDSPEFSKTGPSNEASGFNPSSLTLFWGDSAGALAYEYCIDTDLSCTPWISTETETSVTLSALAGAETYYWQVLATGSSGTTYANGAEGALWSFTTFDPALLTETSFIPMLSR